MFPLKSYLARIYAVIAARIIPSSVLPTVTTIEFRKYVPKLYLLHTYEKFDHSNGNLGNAHGAFKKNCSLFLSASSNVHKSG
ncbi:hypothetical protein D3C80_2104810 [compost metagenome]